MKVKSAGDHMSHHTEWHSLPEVNLPFRSKNYAQHLERGIPSLKDKVALIILTRQVSKVKVSIYCFTMRKQFQKQNPDSLCGKQNLHRKSDYDCNME